MSDLQNITENQTISESSPDTTNGEITPKKEAGPWLAEKTVGSTDSRQELKLPPWQWKAILVLNNVSGLLNGYDVSNVANIQAPIYEEFGHIGILPWVALSYTMGAIALTPLIRKLINIFDARFLYPIFYLIFMLSSAVSGSAPNIHAVIIGRVLMGMGYVGIFQLNLTFISVFANKRDAARIAGVFGLFWAIGLIIGPFVSAGFAENSTTTWRWAFYINLPFLGVLLIAAAICVPSYTVNSSMSLRSGLAEIDFVGATLHCVVAVLLPTALVMSGSTWQWNSASAITTWIVLVIVFVVYILQQKFALFTTCNARIFPVGAITHRTAGLAALGASCSSVSYAVSLYYLPLLYAFTRGASPLDAAVHIIPFIGVFIATIIISSIALPRVGYYAVYFVLAGILMLVGAALMTTITAGTSNSSILGFQALLALGIGLVFANAFSVANASLSEPHERIAASALFNMASFSGICLALAVAGSVYHNRGFSLLEKRLEDFGLDDRQIREALAGLASPVLQTNPRIRGIVAETVSQVVADIFYIAVAAGSVCLLGGLAMKWERLDFVKTVELPEDKGHNDLEEQAVRSAVRE